MVLAEAMWTHGHSMQIEYPANLAKVWKAGFYIEIEGKPNTQNWFHFAIPTPVIVNNKRLHIDSAMLLFETRSPEAIVRDVHIFDGAARIVSHNGVNLTGDANFQRFNVPNNPEVKWGIGISVGVAFGNGSESLTMRFKSAGCDFVS